jgi:hypothetical protein
MAVAKLEIAVKPKRSLDLVTLTPEMALKLLEHNTLNRPLNQQHVSRIVRQIQDGKWRFNGDTIKIADSGDVVDGQHRLWAVAESKRPVETIIVYGVPREAFSTIDTVRKPRSGADVLALCGAPHYRDKVAAALAWLLRWQRGVIVQYRAPRNKIENSDIEEAYANHPAMTAAIERIMPAISGLAPPSVMGFLYYIFASRNQEIADRMVEVLENPSGVGVRDPFFRLRVYLIEAKKRREPEMTVALAIKAANAAKAGDKIEKLIWRQHGDRPEEFPKLKI